MGSNPIPDRFTNFYINNHKNICEFLGLEKNSNIRITMNLKIRQYHTDLKGFDTIVYEFFRFS